MQQNVSRPERFASVLMGSWALAKSLSSKRSKLHRISLSLGGAGLIWRGLSGFCPVYDKMGKTALQLSNSPNRHLEKTIAINRPLDEVREILGEGDPVWRFSDSTLLPMNAGNHLWDLHLREADSKRTLIHATLSNPAIKSTMHGRWQFELLKQALDTELRKLKARLETGEIPTIEGQAHGQRSPALPEATL